MDPVKNPFAPGAGTPPPELAGREDVIETARIALSRLKAGRPTTSVIMVGLRGVGKTVLLVEIERMAEADGYRTLFIEAHDRRDMPSLLVPGIRKILISLNRIEAAKNLSQRALRVLKGFVSKLSFRIEGIEFGLGVEAEHGVADSGDIEIDLPDLFQAVGEAARAAGVPVAILVDEMQYLSRKDFSALIMAVHRTNQRRLPVILIGAGLPQIIGLSGNSKSYAERLFTFPEIGALSAPEAMDALRLPVEAEGAMIGDDAIARLLSVTRKYPYFLQQWGYESWNLATGDTIMLPDVESAGAAAVSKLDEGFFKVRFDRCTPAEKRYMRALAELETGTGKSGDVADILGVKVTSLGPTRSSLITKGMIYSPAYGDVEFTVPLFDEYMKRTMDLP